MNVRIVVEVDGEMVAEIWEDVETLDGLAVEERVEQIKQRAGRAMLEKGLGAVGESCRRPCCCGRSMRNEGRRSVTVTSRSGEVVFDRARYRCRVCKAYQTPADALVCCGAQRVTRLLAKKGLSTRDHRAFHAAGAARRGSARGAFGVRADVGTGATCGR